MDKGDRGALAALGMMLAAVTIVAVVTSVSHDPSYSTIGNINASEIIQRQNGEISQPIPGFNPWVDSYAQWLMATFSIVATGISIWAVKLVKHTLAETKRTADAANDANRPWIEVVITEKRSFSIKPGLARVEFMVSLKNRGKSPGISVMPRAILVAVPESGHEPYAAVNRLDEMMDDWEIRHPEIGTTIFPGVELEPQLFGANLFRKKLDAAVGGPGNKARFWVAIGVRYKFGNQWCRTSHGYLLKFKGRPETFSVSDSIDLKSDEFSVNPMGQDYAT